LVSLTNLMPQRPLVVLHGQRTQAPHVSLQVSANP
jgi:hypothetical protein